MAKSKRKTNPFLSAFRLEDTYLRRPDRKNGQPGLLAGFDNQGNVVLVKLWPKQSDVEDADLQQVWHHEVRQLHRLGGYRGASELIATLHDSQYDAEGFYLVLKPGQRQPLATLRRRLNPGHWLLNPRSSSNRWRLWQNLKRIAEGLEILHKQGLIHRNFDTWSVLTSGDNDPDFMLTGFEWSLRLASAVAPNKAAGKKKGLTSEVASFLQDWKQFGLLASDLLGVNVKRVEDRRISASDVADYLSAAEVRLLRNLVQAEPLERLDGEVVASTIDGILTTLDATIAGLNPKFHLVLNLGTGSALTNKIRETISSDIEPNEIDEQLQIVADDLSDKPLLIAVKSGPEDFRFVLRGRELVYSVRQFFNPRSQESTWDFAYCTSPESSLPAETNVHGTFELEPGSIEVIPVGGAPDRLARLRGKLSSWLKLRENFKEPSKTVDRRVQYHRALALTQFLEALYAAADAYPVHVYASTALPATDEHLMSLEIRDQPERDALSDALGIESPADRLEKLLEEGRVDKWTLTEGTKVGQKQLTDTDWRYERRDSTTSPPRFSFIGGTPLSSDGDALLISADVTGRDSQFKRRLKALYALSEHSELLGMLVDPRGQVTDTHDLIEPDESFNELDESKRTAFESIVGTMPLFMVQGPPGVGKTRLVRDLVTNTFRTDPSSRVLLTAQSNAAVDHLLDELHGTMEKEDGGLVVRCRAADSTDTPGPYETAVLASTLLTQLARSELAKESPDHLRDATERLAGTGGSSRSGYGRQAFEGLLVRAANIVFATTNSYELERLIEDKSQFDWTIIEEAGKATGSELLSPLLLSHRRLMIGDHKQLAPFGSDRIVRLLENPENVRIALETGQEFISRSLRDESTEEVLRELTLENFDLPALCGLARRCLLMFEHLVEEEFDFQRRKEAARPIAQTLTKQHRMHPAIARVVSHSFYQDSLKTHQSAEKRFSESACPVSYKSLHLDKPIVFVDMPYVQQEVGAKRQERRPVWHNPSEVDVVKDILTNISASIGAPKQPSLAILSPYSEQVKRLKRAIDEEKAAFPNLTQFRPAVSVDSYCGTVDSFQGNEADVVVISLVRNNHHSSVKAALGFLSQYRRVNVLVSRARWRMILIGSRKFFEQVLRSSQGTEAGKDIEFLKRFFNALDHEVAKGFAQFVAKDLSADGGGR